MAVEFEIRQASHPSDVKKYDTDRLRKEFLIERIFVADQVQLVYTGYDRYIAGGIMPVSKSVKLEAIDPLKADYFCARREVGLINIGGPGFVLVDGKKYILETKEALYIGRGAREVVFESADKSRPAKFYLNSATAHKEYPSRKVTRQDAKVLDLGSSENANERQIIQFIVEATVPTCQLQMGLTELKPGSIWNTMPAHTHNRRMEVYFYSNIQEGQAVCHFMGEPRETRHIWVHNDQAVISPAWSIHAGAGTGSYFFIWGMAGENLDFTDMDPAPIIEMK
jgi:4-deoxy-L-threo-5-hexosulose-uronate ketol-isomerase